MFKSLSEHRASPTSITARLSPRQSPTQFSDYETDCRTMICDSIFQVKTPYGLIQNHPYHDYAKKLTTIDSCHKAIDSKLSKINELFELDAKNDHNLIIINFMIHRYSLYLFLLTQPSQISKFKRWIDDNPGQLVEYIKKNKNEFYEIILLISKNEKSINALMKILDLQDIQKLTQDIAEYQTAKQQLEQKRQDILDSIAILESKIEHLKIKIDDIDAQATNFENSLRQDPTFFKTPRFNSLKQLFGRSSQVTRFFSDSACEENAWGQFSAIDDIKISKTVIASNGRRFYGNDRVQAILRATLYESFIGIENASWRIQDLEPILPEGDGFHP